MQEHESLAMQGCNGDTMELLKQNNNNNNNKDVEKSTKTVTIEDREATLRQLVARLADETSLHGVKQLHDRKGLRKYIWLSALILATLLVIVLFKSTVNDYLEYRTYIETQYLEDIDSLPFPTVTLCFSDNFIDFKYESFPANVTLEEYKRIFSIVHKDSKVTEEDLALFERINITSYEQLMRSFQLTLQDTVLHKSSLIFNHGKHCWFSKQKCTMDDLNLVWKIDGRRSCLQFNPYRPGNKSREQTVIFSPFRVYLDVRAKSNRKFFQRGLYRYNKITLYVHDYGTPHEVYIGQTKNSVLQDSYTIDTGGLSVFKMDRNQVDYLPYPYGNCGSKKMSVVKYYPYSVGACIMDCTLQYLINKCGCVRFDLQYAVGTEIPICTTSQMVNCFIPANGRNSENARRESLQCINQCPLHCQRFNFNIHRENKKLPNHHDEDIAEYLGLPPSNRSQAQQYIQDQIFGVELKYRRMRKYTQTYTPLVSLTVLLATIGGSIGLGMGLSLLTIVEFLIFVVDSIRAMCMRCKLR